MRGSRLVQGCCTVGSIAIVTTWTRSPAGRCKGCTCTPWILLFRFFAEHYSCTLAQRHAHLHSGTACTLPKRHSMHTCTASDTEMSSVSFPHSEIRQQVLVFHKTDMPFYP